MGLFQFLGILLLADNVLTVTPDYVSLRPSLDLNLDDNLLTIGGKDYPYHLAVKADAPDLPSNEQLKLLVETDTTVETCRDEFLSIRQEHTMCLRDSPKVVFSGVPATDREVIVAEHNRFRSQSAPEATDMQKMVWDDSLAELAQKWVKQCIVGHDDLKAREIQGYGATGQCAAGGYRTWAGAVKGWHDEVQEYRYGENPDDYVTSKVGVGHYIQIMQNTTVLVGCGYTECVDSKYRRYFMCNYATGNELRPGHPYTKGTRCDHCKTHCVDGLCDCKGKFCFNNGELDIQTCTCSCKEIYTGDICQTLQCPDIDTWYCGTRYQISDCELYPALKYTCPYMCGVCQVLLGKGLRVAMEMQMEPPPEMFLSKHGCLFVGQRSSPERCTKLGARGLDRGDCETMGGFYSCNECSTFAVRDNHCPVMCGVCDAPCEGKHCLHGGKLDVDTCQCSCFPNYDGELCQNFTCPESDLPGCARSFTPEECVNPYVISKCPYFCGVCELELPCDGKVCENRGVLNLESCQCECKKGYEGDTCGIFICPDMDPNGCKTIAIEECDQPRVVDTCPYFCGRCKSAFTTLPPPTTVEMNRTVEPGVFISSHGCRYSGSRPSQEMCMTLGDGGFDLDACETQGGVVGCVDCEDDEIQDQCPVMCAVCDPPCQGKTCLNTGRLNTVTCQCECTKRFYGHGCQQVFCPVADDPKCEDKDQSQCAEDTTLEEDCPYLCGLCTEITNLQRVKPKSESDIFISKHGCAFFGERYTENQCKMKGIRGFDEPLCDSEGGSVTCSQCGDKEIVNHCPVMCGACDPPCGDKVCENGGQVKVDGSCDCKCLPFYQGELCETLVCPDEEKLLCSKKTAADCLTDNSVMRNCPYLCGPCIRPSTPPLPVYISDHGCQFVGLRLDKDKCSQKGFRGFDKPLCETKGGNLSCSDCEKSANQCPVMCGLCDPPCGTKACLNGGTLKVDGSCVCKCLKFFTGDICQTLTCPVKDAAFCKNHGKEDCLDNGLPGCPYLCGLCIAPTTTTTPTPVFTSSHGCQYLGDRPDPSICAKRGRSGFDSFKCETVGGELRCPDCQEFKSLNLCPVMCGMCDHLCNEKTCQNGGTLLVDGSCNCKCPPFFVGEVCEKLDCPSSDKKMCMNKNASECAEAKPLQKNCPYLCGICQYPSTTPPPPFVSEFGCEFTGERLVKKQCVKLGDSGFDREDCGTQGGAWECGDCVTHSNDCPIMCGICDVPCDGLTCVNGGKLNVMKCLCVCTKNFDGERCEIAKCGNKTCQNGGSLKIDGSCDCKCPALHIGDLCETLVCPEKDKPKCEKLTEDDCVTKVKLWESCPILCGVCEPPPPPRFISTYGCTFVGERPSKCKKMGQNGMDLKTCATEGGIMGCEECTTVGNSCPVMCGLCDAPCDGKRCLNDGKLNTNNCLCKCPANFIGDTCEKNLCGDKACQNGGTLKIDGSCECKCPALHVGDFCETLVCPDKDKGKCKNKTESDCEKQDNLWVQCPILCGVCEAPPPPKFVSKFGCTYVGERPAISKCKKMGLKGYDMEVCASEGGAMGCDDCVTNGTDCPVMCGLCDAPCDGKTCLNGGKLNLFNCLCKCAGNFDGDICETNLCGDKACQNGGTLKIDGSCECKCPALHVGEFCETLMCPDKDKGKCKNKTKSDCEEKVNLWVQCPILCGVCEAPPPPEFLSSHGCTYVGERPKKSECKKLGKNGMDIIDVCESEGGPSGCEECVTVANDCPVMCGLCDAPCDGKRCLNGGKLNTFNCLCKCVGNFVGETCQTNQCGEKTCQNGGVLKVDGSCECKCPALHQGELCETLVCPDKDKGKCRNKTKSECEEKKNLWVQCPILCGVCEASPPPRYLSSYNCTYIGERPSKFQCGKLGVRGMDNATCASEGGASGCEDCVTIGNDCPVMCGLCDAPCEGKRCLNGGKLNTFKCVCKCLPNFYGETCAQVSCPSTDKQLCGKGEFTEDTCEGNPKTRSNCPFMCGLCQERRKRYADLPPCDLECFHGGVLDLLTCRCHCHPNYQGKKCQKYRCPEFDDPLCDGLSPAQCDFNQLILDDCPHLCHRCNAGFCDKEDPWYCPKIWKPLDCDIFIQVRRQCPSMCGLCTKLDPPETPLPQTIN